MLTNKSKIKKVEKLLNELIEVYDKLKAQESRVCLAKTHLVDEICICTERVFAVQLLVKHLLSVIQDLKRLEGKDSDNAGTKGSQYPDIEERVDSGVTL